VANLPCQSTHSQKWFHTNSSVDLLRGSLPYWSWSCSDPPRVPLTRRYREWSLSVEFSERARLPLLQKILSSAGNFQRLARLNQRVRARPGFGPSDSPWRYLEVLCAASWKPSDYALQWLLLP
jgi:hypothetical protein